MSIASKTAKTSIGLTLLAVCFIVVPWISGQNSSPEALAKGGRTGPNSGLNSQVLNYKLVPWPLEAKSAAGFDAGPWNFIQVASVATHPKSHTMRRMRRLFSSRESSVRITRRPCPIS